MARRRKNGRFTKSTRRRRSKPKTNLTNLAVSYLVANTISENVAGIGLKDFFLAGSDFSEYGATGWSKTGDPFNSTITLRELLSGSQGASNRATPIAAMTANAKKNALPLLVGVVGIPIAAKVLTKLIRKPVILPLNRMIRTTGLDVKV